MSVAGVYLELVKVAASAVCDFDFFFALVFGDEPLQGAVAHTLQYRSERKSREGDCTRFQSYRNVLGHRIVDDKRHAATKLN